MTEEYREEVIERLYQLYGYDFGSEDAYLLDRFDHIAKMNAPIDVAVEWLADDMAEMEQYR